MNLNITSYQTNYQNYSKSKNLQNDKSVVQSTQVANTSPNFKGAMCFPKAKLTINPKRIASIVGLSFVIGKLGERFDDEKDHLYRGVKWNSWGNGYGSGMRLIERGDSEITEWNGKWWIFAPGKKCNAIETGEIVLESGDKYQYTNIVEVPPHLVHKEYPDYSSLDYVHEGHYDNYLKAHSLQSLYNKALVDDETYTFDCDIEKV